MANRSDETALLQRATRGDLEALSSLLASSGPQIAAGLRGEIDPKWQSVLEVDDVMQVTFIEAFLNFGRFDGDNMPSFVAWLRRIAQNNLRDAVRALGREKRPQPSKRVHAAHSDDSYISLIEQMGGATTTIGTKVARREARSILHAAIEHLPDDYAMVLRLYDLEGLSGPEVADRMGRRRGAIHMLRSRALVRLREYVGTQSNFFSAAD